VHGVDGAADFGFVASSFDGDADSEHEGEEEFGSLLNEIFAEFDVGVGLADEHAKSFAEGVAVFAGEVLEAGGRPIKFGRAVDQQAALLAGARDEVVAEEVEECVDPPSIPGPACSTSDENISIRVAK
jgi:hypothetical protein